MPSDDHLKQLTERRNVYEEKFSKGIPVRRIVRGSHGRNRADRICRHNRSREYAADAGPGMRQDDGSVMAKITAVTSSTLTVVMAEKPEMQNDGTMPEKPADGETPPEKPADGENPPEKLEDGETPPQRQEGQMEQKEMNFSDEESSLTLTSDTVVTKGTDHESSSVSHLAEGSVVRLVLDGTTVVSIDILE